MYNQEEIYNEAVEMLKKGFSEEEVLFKFAEYKEALAPLLALSAALLAMPKNIVPTPQMKRKYAMAKAKNFWLTWLPIPKFAGVSMSIMLLLSAFTALGYQALNSAPGQAFFPVKKSVENLQLLLASSQDAKASLQIQIAQSRLSDAQEIFSNPNSGAGQKTAALNELADQTSNAVAQVNTAAQSNPGSDQNHPLLSSLDSITQDQKNLLAQIKPDSQIDTAASSALDSLIQNTAIISQIKQTVAAADSEQTLAQLNANQNAVAVLGSVGKVTKDQVTVDQSVFTLTPQTAYQDTDGNTLSQQDLTQNARVNVIGIKDQNTLVAQQVTIISSNNPQTAGSGAGTTTPETADSAKTASTTSATVSLKKTSDGSQTADQSSSSTTESSQTDSNTATGSFILESPSPQFVK